MNLGESVQRQDDQGVNRVGGLPVLEQPQWTDVKLSDEYRVTVSLIGDAIVYIRPSGYATMPELDRVLDLTADIERSRIGPERPFVHLADYSELRGASMEARGRFISYMLARPRLAGMVFYRASPLIAASIKIGERLNIVTTRIELVDDLDEAVACCDRMLREADSRQASAVVDRTALGVGECISSTDWQITLREFHLRWELIDGTILHGVASGYIGAEHVPAILDVVDGMLSLVGCDGGGPSIVVDMSGIDGVTAAARRPFVDRMREWHRGKRFRALALYGANNSVKGAVAISRPFLPFRIIVARSLEAAVRRVRRDPHGRRRLVDWLRPWRTSHAAENDGSLGESVDDVLRFLAEIDWQTSGVIPLGEPRRKQHPLAPVFDAVTLIKSDVDQLFEERTRVERALIESEERYRSILDDIVDGYYEIDLKGTMKMCNDSLLRILGYDRVELEGLNSRAYMDREHAHRVLTAFRRVYTTGRPARSLDWQLIRKDGKRIAVEASISPIVGADDRPTGFRGIVRDVTARVSAEKEREDLEARLRQAQRLEAVGTLAGGIAHNFNNLLMGIQGNSSLIKKQTDPTHPHRHRLETIEALVRGGSKLTAQLLGYARAGSYELRALDINQLVRQTADTFSLTRKEIRIHEELADTLLTVRADRGQIEQVLLNLFINGAEAMPTGGDLFVGTRLVSQEALRGKPYDPQPGRYVCVSIRDSGIGMDQQTMRRAFEPFFTTKGISGGTGLGLASVYGTVKAHGGYVDAVSELGTGSTFTIFLPATREAVRALSESSGTVVLGRGTVLVVDDDEAVLEACASILSYLQYSPLRASSGQQAIEVFTARRGEIDLVILDLILPDIGGGEVYDSMCELDPGVKVLLSSGYSIDGQASRILERGCDDFIQKPYTIEDLSQKVGEVLNRT